MCFPFRGGAIKFYPFPSESQSVCHKTGFQSLTLVQAGVITLIPISVLITTKHLFTMLITTNHLFTVLITTKHLFTMLITTKHLFTVLITTKHLFTVLITTKHLFTMLITTKHILPQPNVMTLIHNTYYHKTQIMFKFG